METIGQEIQATGLVCYEAILIHQDLFHINNSMAEECMLFAGLPYWLYFFIHCIHFFFELWIIIIYFSTTFIYSLFILLTSFINWFIDSFY